MDGDPRGRTDEARGTIPYWEYEIRPVPNAWRHRRGLGARPGFGRTLRPSPAPQCSDEVGRTSGFLKAQDARWFRDVRLDASRLPVRAAPAGLPRAVTQAVPSGFTGESDAPPRLRSEEIAIIQAEVEEAQRHPRRRMA